MAITRAQQFRQMLEDGGMLVQPSTTGKRPGYRRSKTDASGGGLRGSAKDPGSPGPSDSGGDGPKGLSLRGTIDRRPPTITPEPKPRDDMFFGDEPMPMMGPSLRTKIGRGIRSVFDKTLLGRIINRLQGPPPGNPEYNKAANFISRPDINFGGRDETGNRLLFPMMAQGPQTMDNVLEEDDEEEKKPFKIAPRFAAEGGRIGLQEGGGIEQRLEQLGGDVTSAEQMLQGINKRLETAESSLGSGGGGLGSIAQPFMGGIPQPLAAAGPNVGTLIPQPRPGPFMGRPLLQPINATLPETLLEAVQPLEAARPISAGQPIQEPTVLEAKPAEPFDPNKPNLRPFKFQPNVHTGLFHNYDTAEAGYEAAVADAKRIRDEGFKGRTELTGEMGFDRFKNIFDNLNNPNLIEKNYLASLNQRSGVPAAGYADGGNVVGGEFDFESARQMYGLGKLVKKVTRSVKKIAKSPVGKAAIAAALFRMGGGLSETGFLKSKALPFLVGTSRQVGPPGSLQTTKGILGVGGRFDPFKTILATSGIAGLMAGQEEEDETVSPEQLGPGLNIPEYRRDPFGNLAIRYRAEGGSTEQKEPVAKKTMPLLDMGGMEKDYREDGGFVPIGRMEKADDVPARLSKNEFVFTADAVRNAGDGDVDKGAEVMYNMMKNLEAGGEVSEESQGLEGARRMFQTSQRLEEVL